MPHPRRAVPKWVFNTIESISLVRAPSAPQRSVDPKTTVTEVSERDLARNLVLLLKLGGIPDECHRTPHHFIVTATSATKLAAPVRELSYYNS